MLVHGVGILLIYRRILMQISTEKSL